MIFLRLRPKLDFNYVKPCFDLFQFSYNIMTKGFSKYMARFCNLNLDIKSIRQKDGQAKTESDRQTMTKTDRQSAKD